MNISTAHVLNIKVFIHSLFMYCLLELFLLVITKGVHILLVFGGRSQNTTIILMLI